MIWIDLENKLPTDTDIPNWAPWSQEKWQQWLAKSETLLNDLQRLNVEDKTEGRNDLIENNSAHWGELKPWLKALSFGKCWFSETKDLFSHLDVEHFRPKKKAKNIDSSERDGYWWLAFNYMNFRLCGNVGNRKKGVWFPLKEGSLVSCFENQIEESESSYLVDPIEFDDVQLIAFDEEGKLIPAPGISAWNAERVTETAKRLKLNEHDELTEARRDKWQEINKLIKNYTEALSRCNGVNPAAKQKAKDAALKIQALTRPDQELSTVARWAVIFRNDPQLSRLVA